MYRSENKSYILDSRETAPEAASRDMFLGLPNLAKTIGRFVIEKLLGFN